MERDHLHHRGMVVAMAAVEEGAEAKLARLALQLEEVVAGARPSPRRYVQLRQECWFRRLPGDNPLRLASVAMRQSVRFGGLPGANAASSHR